MAQEQRAHETLKRQFQNVQLFGKLLDFSPVRQKLFSCLSSLVMTNKTFIQDLSTAYVNFVDRRYDFVHQCAKSMLKKLPNAEEKLMNYAFFVFEDKDKETSEEQLWCDSEEPSYFYYHQNVPFEMQKRVFNSNVAELDMLVKMQHKKMLASGSPKHSDHIWEVIFGAEEETSSSCSKENKNDSTLDELLESEEDPVLDDLITSNKLIFVVETRSYMRTIMIGLQIGSFLGEAGWLEDCIKVLKKTLFMIKCLDEQRSENVLLTLDCLQRILNAQSRFCLFSDADSTSNLINEIVERTINHKRVIPISLLAKICKERSMMHFARSEYDLSYNWSIRALKLLRNPIPERIKIEILLQAGKSCVVKRQYKRANMLITLAVKRVKSAYGEYHQKYADALLDYGFYLLNVDSIINSVNVYVEALEIKKRVFGELNLFVAIANEDLAYALYVKEYSSGEFYSAREHIQTAITIMKKLVPSNHLMLASAKRVMALILEEIALDNTNEPDYETLLRQSEELHQSALTLSLHAFGEINVQTAKHYGNLGRLYQSMMKFNAAEQMHKRAIKIKTDLLGAYDYEVGLSIGHLASLYNYQMQKHREAEELYMKSIAISEFLVLLIQCLLGLMVNSKLITGLRLFGETYSGLEYDYRGLCHIYESLEETEKYLEYSRILDNWRNLRLKNEETQVH